MSFKLNNNKMMFVRGLTLLLFIALLLATQPSTIRASEETPEATPETTPLPLENEPPVEEVEIETPEVPAETSEDVAPDGENGDGDTIATGDAGSGVEAETYLNLNDVNETETESEPANDNEDAVPGTSNEAEPDPVASSTVETATTSTPITIAEPDSELVVANENNATTTTNASSSASTGENSVSGSGSSITTGDAAAYANVVNVVNTNIVNSDGLLAFINTALGYDDFDIRDTFEDAFTTNANSTTPCSLEVCADGSTDLTVHNENNARIENDITVMASTGGNNASGDGSSITTGNAYAQANILNVANTNITDSNYLLIVFDNHSSYTGDLILPSSSFFESQFGETGQYSGTTNIHSTNTATIENNIEVEANSGSNTLEGNGGTISTGNAYSRNDVQNTVNTDLFGGSSFTMLIRVHGSWDGDIFGLPEGMSWRQAPGGIELFYEGNGDNTASRYDDVQVESTNTAEIKNNVRVYALTGENEAAGEEATIETGTAYAGASTYNLVNTNIVGQNWANLIFNIYGDWNGNLSFGVPDLWIGAEATSDDTPILPGSEIEYTFTIRNNGDTDAPNTILRTHSHHGLLTLHDPESRALHGNTEEGAWELGTLKAGETKTVTLKTNVNKNVPRRGYTDIELTATVESTTPDGNDADNSEYIELEAGMKPNDVNDPRTTFGSNFDISKVANTDSAQPGDTVDYNVSFFNRAGPLFDAKLVDILTNSDGEIVREQVWPLGEIATWEEIEVAYSIEFSPDTAPGTYTNRAQLLGFHGSERERFQTPYQSELVTHTLTIGDSPAGEVLGASTSCEQYLYDFMREGGTNNASEVRKLQTFLNTFEGAALDINGTFDEATTKAVHAFQREYADDVLSPWGATRSTGYVYLTTRKKINELYCANLRPFPLSTGELDVINDFKANISRERTQVIGLGEPEEGAPRREDDEEVAIEDIITPLPTTPASARTTIIERINTFFGNAFTAALR